MIWVNLPFKYFISTGSNLSSNHKIKSLSTTQFLIPSNDPTPISPTNSFDCSPKPFSIESHIKIFFFFFFFFKLPTLVFNSPFSSADRADASTFTFSDFPIAFLKNSNQVLINLSDSKFMSYDFKKKRSKNVRIFRCS